MRLLLLLLLSTATGALALSVGAKLYVKSKDTLMLKEPKAKAATVTKLQPGAEVTWLGPSEKDKQFHQVEAGGKKGFVRLTDLTPHKPQLERDSATGKLMSGPAFASSGAATKGPYGPSYAPYRGSAGATEAAAELIYLEELNKAKATPEAVAQKNKELHEP